MQLYISNQATKEASAVQQHPSCTELVPVLRVPTGLLPPAEFHRHSLGETQPKPTGSLLAYLNT